MNQNYIAPEALDDDHTAFCRKCTAKFTDVERKIRFYQGECPSCGQNPCTLAVGLKEVPEVPPPAPVSGYMRSVVSSTPYITTERITMTAPGKPMTASSKPGNKYQGFTRLRSRKPLQRRYQVRHPP